MDKTSDHVTTLGTAHSRYGDRQFGIRAPDRLSHMYVIGQTGTGKSALIHNLVVQDAARGQGFCLVEPHGDLADALNKQLSGSCLYWNVSDAACPFGYNPLTRISEAYQPLVVSGLIDTVKKQWPDAWGARMEHLLRFSLLALMQLPNADLRDVVRIFIDKKFRAEVKSRLTDEQVAQFWNLEYPAMNYKTAFDGVAAIANKLGAFLAHPLVRKALCEPKAPLRFRELMDTGRGLVVNLGKGSLGADTSNVLGGLIVSSLMHAAFSRNRTEVADRHPYMLYVDEYHAFSTVAFAGALSETRKYGLGVTLAQQHTHQSDREVIEAVFGNVGTIVAFRVGALDAPLLQRQFGDIDALDLTRLPNHRVLVQLMVDGKRTRTFSATTLPN